MAHFLFQAGLWKGSGTVSFSHSPERLSYTLQWRIESFQGGFRAEQSVQVEGIPPMLNLYTIFEKEEDTFEITLTNELLGTFVGRGILQDKKIGWEFSYPGQLEGVEVYEQGEQGEYLFHSEYSGGDGFITRISGKVMPT